MIHPHMSYLVPRINVNCYMQLGILVQHCMLQDVHT